jgi:alcohol dehydrogenase YqhD (iron-dependent ADH family)
MAYVMHVPTRLVFGAGSINELGKEAGKYGKKAMVVTYPDIRRVGLLDRIISELESNGLEVTVFEKVQPNPRHTMVDEGAELVRKEKAEVVIGLGGGSAMDSAKAIAVASTHDEPFWERALSGIDEGVVTDTTPAIIQVPTLAATGSEMNNAGVYTNWDTREKRPITSWRMAAKVAIVDPELTLTVPKKLTAQGGVDIFAHCIEPYILLEGGAPVNDGIREHLMRMVIEYLPRVLAKPDDIEARTHVSWVSTVAMCALATLGGGRGRGLHCHNIEHGVSALYDVAHADGLAAILPKFMEFILPARKDRIDAVATRVFGKTDGIKAVEEWLESVEMKLRLRDLGCKLEDAEEVANIVIRTCPFSLEVPPLKMEAEQIKEMYRNAY